MKTLGRFVLLVLLAGIALQLYFVARIGLMAWVNPESTAFERSAAYQWTLSGGQGAWRQQWTDYADISNHLKRAVIASEDSSFSEHEGVDIAALEKAWEKNNLAEQRAAQQAARQAAKPAPKRAANAADAAPVRAAKPAKVVGGSTITQQLAKNLFLSGERTLLRKGQELVLTVLLEKLLGKQRILEIYLNSAEWGEGVFGAEAAAQRYFGKTASQLSAYEAARLAVMLPRPKYFETRPSSPYLASRARTIVARMGAVDLPP